MQHLPAIGGNQSISEQPMEQMQNKHKMRELYTAFYISQNGLHEIKNNLTFLTTDAGWDIGYGLTGDLTFWGYECKM